MRASRQHALTYAGASIVLVSIAQLTMRWGMMRLPPLHELLTHSAMPARVSALAALAGVGCYAVSTMSWLIALRHLPLRLAYPLLSVSYVLVYVAAGLIPAFGESLSWSGSIGVLLIVAGVSLLSGDDEDQRGPGDAPQTGSPESPS